MSGLEHLVLSILAPMLKASGEALNDLRKRRKKQKGDYGLYEQELAKTLGECLYQIRTTFNKHASELDPYQLGATFRNGDDIACQRIEIQIAEAKTIKTVIDLACKYKLDVDEVKERWISAETILRDTKQAMNELSTRITLSNTPSSAQSGPPQVGQVARGIPVRLSPSMPQSPQDSIPTISPPPHQDPGQTYAPSPDYFGSQQRSPPTDPMHRLSTSTQDRNSRINMFARRNSGASFNTTSTTESIGSGRSPPPVKSSSRILSGGSIMSNDKGSTLFGRPEKDNGFHGFCEGAWTAQRDPRKGMPVLEMNNGLSSPFIILQCHKCRFRARPFGPNKRHAGLDPNLREASCGIRYRVAFLAKSHEKCKDMFTWGENTDARMAEQRYGCVFCYAEGEPTYRYGGVESLMNHIYLDHRTTISSRTLERTKCILGPITDPLKDFDINIPAIPTPVAEKFVHPIELDTAPPAIPELPSWNNHEVYLGSNMSGPVELDSNPIARISQY